MAYKDGNIKIEDWELDFYVRAIKIFTTSNDADENIKLCLRLVMTNAVLAIINNLLSDNKA